MSNQSNPRPIPASRPTALKSRVRDLETEYNKWLPVVQELDSAYRSGRLGHDDTRVYAAINAAFNERQFGNLLKLVLSLSGKLAALKQRVVALEENDARQDQRLDSLEDASDHHRRILKGLVPRVKKMEEGGLSEAQLKELLAKLELLQQSGGSISNLSSVFVAGITADELAMLQSAKADDPDFTDDHFLAGVIQTLRESVQGVQKTLSSHTDDIADLQGKAQTLHEGQARHTQDITNVNARVDKHVTYINQMDTGGNFWVPLLVGLVVALLSIPLVVRALDNGWLEGFFVAGVFGLTFGVVSEFANRRKKRELLDDSPAPEVHKTEEVEVVEVKERKPLKTKLHDFFVKPENNDQPTQVVSIEVTDKPHGSSAPADESPLNEAPGYFAGSRRS